MAPPSSQIQEPKDTYRWRRAPLPRPLASDLIPLPPSVDREVPGRVLPAPILGNTMITDGTLFVTFPGRNGLRKMRSMYWFGWESSVEMFDGWRSGWKINGRDWTRLASAAGDREHGAKDGEGWAWEGVTTSHLISSVSASASKCQQLPHAGHPSPSHW